MKKSNKQDRGRAENSFNSSLLPIHFQVKCNVLKVETKP